ncbi:S-adenosyl-L-methionine-dependent methyltransferase [Lentinula raphanica]|uniref:S-adenosyl-L-methionine-dependent methyltransferase n=1 Tax=Lentinula raphanica TaxID=153919 RepID=A0AA38P406_9AGAR|nr:methyltransferase [Lentinula raphanica]KAJ3754745.1 S-adenosyl-L-methionine-dependent methyltransferase [Lentinula raphanica]KAJ3772831.1 S-adenosyl-L-methionine-dependent methyltransferase [Lentinula raphanica]KAJ3820649.1 S-adenosyl-L-methionine-dependent methyltransferase [Lentinula raphanica]KAJ3835701.1 S-adenosyl-L-methionine-dependent methyltransferase [Lentinula raphanica]
MSASDPKTIVKDGYDAIALKYHQWASPRPTKKRTEYIERLGQSLPKGSKVLELGCGAGLPATQQLVDQGFDVTGVDISSSQLALAKEHVPAAHFMQGDMMAIEFPEQSFDAVMAFYSLFHLPRDEHGLMLKKMVQWLKPGGWLLFNTGTKEEERTRDWMGVKMFSSSLGVEGNEQILAEYGLELTDVEAVIDAEMVGSFEEKFHWIWARKGFRKIDTPKS